MYAPPCLGSDNRVNDVLHHVPVFSMQMREHGYSV